MANHYSRWTMPAGALRHMVLASMFLAMAACGSDEAKSDTHRSGVNGAPRAPITETLDSRVTRACNYLWSRQGEDGGWHGDYGVFRGGAALTPFLLHALMSVPTETRAEPAGATDRALAFIRASINAEGAIGYGEIMQYPGYATSYGLRCLILAGRENDKPAIVRMRQWLLAAQYQEAKGFKPSDAAWGGWGMGEIHGPGVSGHMDLAHTRRAIEALRDASAIDEPARTRAESFLGLVQRRTAELDRQPIVPEAPETAGSVPFDGGFYFSPVVLGANKGRHEPAAAGQRPYYRSYATTTCDGLLCLLAIGLGRDDERVTSARSWLDKYPFLDRPEGIPLDSQQPWYEALYYYHLCARAEVYAVLGWPTGMREGIAGRLSRHQREDGSFKNEWSVLMKEDDPLLATGLALIAMNHAVHP